MVSAGSIRSWWNLCERGLHSQEADAPDGHVGYCHAGRTQVWLGVWRERLGLRSPIHKVVKSQRLAVVNWKQALSRVVFCHSTNYMDVSLSSVTHNWETMRTAVNNYIGSLNWGYRVSLRDKNVNYVNAYAEFTEPHKIKVNEYFSYKGTFCVCVQMFNLDCWFDLTLRRLDNIYFMYINFFYPSSSIYHLTSHHYYRLSSLYLVRCYGDPVVLNSPC